MIMRGYHRQPERSRRAFTTDGWLRTGDIASMDEDGYVAIVDRKKDIIISSAGKNMAPARIERTLAGGDPRIAAVLVIGDRRPYNVALVVLEPRTDADDPGVREAVSRAIAEGNRRLSRAEQVKRWTILADTWSLGGDEITATGKPRRAAITAKYAEEIDALYAGPGESRLAEL
jgi:long-chain acyl-CoA synthetase